MSHHYNFANVVENKNNYKKFSVPKTSHKRGHVYFRGDESVARLEKRLLAVDFMTNELKPFDITKSITTFYEDKNTSVP